MMHFTEEQMRAARAVAAYEIGDPTWVDVIVGALKYPAETLAALASEDD